jgi:hypothetical protein
VTIFLDGNSREKGGNTREKGRNTRADSAWLKHENMKWSFFLDMVIFILELTIFKNMVRNLTKICPGQKFVTNDYPGIYIYMYTGNPYTPRVHTGEACFTTYLMLRFWGLGTT